MSDLVKLCGLRKIVEEHRTYLTGEFGLSRLYVLRNCFKKTPDDSDYFIFVAPKKGSRKDKRQGPTSEDVPPAQDEIPF